MSQSKPILIDALRINMGGGLSLLNYLVSSLLKRNVDFVLLKDFRCPTLNDEIKLRDMRIMRPDDSIRKRFYENHGNDFHSVLCFGNVPPPIKIRPKVIVYYHNVSLLKIPKDYSLKWKLLSKLKQLYLRNQAKYADEWWVQTMYTALLLNKKVVKGRAPIEILPFYFLPDDLKTDSEISDAYRKDYVFVGEYTNAKGHQYLLEAWSHLHEMGIDQTLHLTVTDPEFCKSVEDAIQKGVRIINHKHIPFKDVVNLYKKSKATIYPSLNESLGLGIIEAIEAGCDVIGSDLPFLHSVCLPSEVFESRNAKAIVEAVLRYEQGNSEKTKIKIYDNIDDVIDRLTDSNTN